MRHSPHKALVVLINHNTGRPDMHSASHSAEYSHTQLGKGVRKEQKSQLRAKITCPLFKILSENLFWNLYALCKVLDISKIDGLICKFKSLEPTSDIVLVHLAEVSHIYNISFLNTTNFHTKTALSLLIVSINMPTAKYINLSSNKARNPSVRLVACWRTWL